MVGFIFMLLIVLGVAAAWVYAFAQLMMLDEGTLTGRYDKLLWVGVFVLVVPLAPFAFLFWKYTRSAVS